MAIESWIYLLFILETVREGTATLWRWSHPEMSFAARLQPNYDPTLEPLDFIRLFCLFISNSPVVLWLCQYYGGYNDEWLQLKPLCIPCPGNPAAPHIAPASRASLVFRTERCTPGIQRGERGAVQIQKRRTQCTVGKLVESGRHFSIMSRFVKYCWSFLHGFHRS